MFYTLILAIHLAIAILTVLVIGYALYVLRYSIVASYRTCALLLGFVAASEVFSGTALAVLSSTLSALSLSTHIAVYLGVCLLVEALLFFRLKKAHLVFPATLVASPVLVSCIMFAAAISLSF